MDVHVSLSMSWMVFLFAELAGRALGHEKFVHLHSAFIWGSLLRNDVLFVEGHEFDELDVGFGNQNCESIWHEVVLVGYFLRDYYGLRLWNFKKLCLLNIIVISFNLLLFCFLFFYVFRKLNLKMYWSWTQDWDGMVVNINYIWGNGIIWTILKGK